MLQPITPKLIQEVAAKIADKFQPEKIILFGSYAWGSPGPDSDMDLLVVKDTAESTHALARAIDGYIFPRLFPLDLIVYTPRQVEERCKVDPFVRMVVTKGKTLYAQSR
jgi:predicted nucleotidyltransferase